MDVYCMPGIPGKFKLFPGFDSREEEKSGKICIIMKQHNCMTTTDKRTDVWSRPSCIYTQIFSPKKTGFSPIKNTFQIFFDFCLPLFYATFQCGP